MSDESRPTRRAVLGGCCGVAAATLAGCAGGPGDAEVPAAIGLASGRQCDVCGMVVADHPGPNGQIFYADNEPEGHDNPARFDSLKGCLFPYYFEHEQFGWDDVAVYVTDYAAVDYSLRSEGDTTYISGHTDPSSFALASSVTFVVGSGVHGAMGPDFVPFSAEADAEAFRDEHGGELYGFADISPADLGR